MKYAIVLIVAFFWFSRAHGQQYNLFETILTCDKSQKELIVAGHDKNKLVLKAMVKEGKLLNFMANQQYRKDNIVLSYTVAAENESRFKEIIADWKKRADHSYPELIKNFWKGCPKRKDSIVNNSVVTYPVIKNLDSPVAVVEGIDELPDPKLEYKIVIDFTTFPTVGENKIKIDSSSTILGISDLYR